MKRKEYYMIVRKNGYMQPKKIKLYDSQVEKRGKYGYPYYKGHELFEELEYAEKAALKYYYAEN